MRKFGAPWLVLLAGIWAAAQAAPELKMDLPDWKSTTVDDRDLGHGVHMLESFGGNIGVVAGREACCWWTRSGRSSMTRCVPRSGASPSARCAT